LGIAAHITEREMPHSLMWHRVIFRKSGSIPLSPEPVADAYDLLDGRIWTARLD